ncbi:helix-turn-helix transcriptional regulator [Mesorhizobium sp. NBSH29]|uniref:helix-turn-helix transcriptional regulator n=1 Tax=Mesorhizobium sp. NBSH29 TaxID=2654249 RepID=UPI0021560C67|nr:LuxR C-terminal-related transcriptional regulator [Mesorhizobium sp. NBSH29]
MLVSVVHDQDRNDVRIIASNWIYDAIQTIGHDLIVAIVLSAGATVPGTRPRLVSFGNIGNRQSMLNSDQTETLTSNGHREMCCLVLGIGRARAYLILSARRTGQIDQQAAWQAQMHCAYALSQAPDLIAPALHQDPLSDRERECLFWVSEGKTTDEVSVILGVSSNTVNSYITHAIQKFAASNRAMAIATAIRNGII